MKTVVLNAKNEDSQFHSTNLVTLVNKEDYERVIKHSWHVKQGKRTFYAVAKIKNKQVRLHHFILQVFGKQIDHINNNGLDNRKANLRFVTTSQNARNRRGVTGTSSKFKGVSRYTHKNGKLQWRALLQYREEGKRRSVHCGLFDGEKSAALAYNEAAIKYFGEFAHLNEV